MKNHARDLKRGNCLSPTNLALLGNPLDFIHEDHLREREICAQMDALVGDGTPDAETAICILAFLREELPLHLEDEEEDLFPLLRRRCEPDDEIDRAIARLSEDHRHAEQGTPRVLTVLDAIAAGDGLPSEDASTALTRYAAQARRHLILENAIILPLARLRLTKDDLDMLCLGMMQRRGLDRLLETADAD